MIAGGGKVPMDELYCNCHKRSMRCAICRVHDIPKCMAREMGIACTTAVNVLCYRHGWLIRMLMLL